jgi:hypothetical protein
MSGVAVCVARNSLTLRPRNPGNVVQPNWYIIVLVFPRLRPSVFTQLTGLKTGHYIHFWDGLDIQVDYFKGVFFDELAARFYVFAH